MGGRIFIVGRTETLHQGLQSEGGKGGGSIVPSSRISKSTIGTSALLEGRRPKGNPGIQDGSLRLKLTHRFGGGQHLIRPRISHQSPEYGGPNHHLGSVSAP